ncbi:MAG TPA: hypothetical protein VJ884_07785, partial [Salinibacter sp.]|nr:hypothetical protein [Salinibacter sp.]
MSAEQLLSPYTPVIGGGGYGVVFQLSQTRVLKAIKDVSVCGDASVEASKQRKVRSCTDALKLQRVSFGTFGRAVTTSEPYQNS